MSTDVSPKISIVIPSFNSLDLFDCINYVLTQDYHNIEVVVIDNSTDSNIWSQLQEKFGLNRLVKLLKPKYNTGITGGRNLGLKLSDKNSKYVLFLDHDVFLEKNALSELLKIAELDNSVGVVTGKIFYFEHPRIIWSAGTSINPVTGQIHFSGGEDCGQFDEIREVQVAPSIIFTRKSLADKIGGFDNLFFANYEDTDFCFRVRESGFKVVYTPYARALHKIPLDQKVSNNRLIARSNPIARNRIIFMKRHSKYFGVFLFFLPVYTGYYGLLSLRLHNTNAFKDFFRGTISGLVIAFHEKKLC